MIGYLIGAVVFTAWSFYIVKFINKVVYKSLKFLENPDPNIEERFKPFERLDRKKWNMNEMYLTGIFLLPFRIFIIIFGMICLVLFLFVLVGFKPNAHKEEYPVWKRNAIMYVSRCFARIIMLCCGIYWIEKNQAQISDFDKDYPVSNTDLSTKTDRAPIIISNHVTWLDIIYHCSSSHFPSFLSKKEVQNIPLFGAAAKAFQCIFVDRESELNRSQIPQELRERGDLIKQGKNFPPIVIFPEGTTTNGTHLISFKRGAFQSLLPIKMVCVEYPIRNFNVALDILGMGENALLMLCQFKNHLRITEFDTYYPDHLNLSHERDEDVLIYARKLKSIMLQALNLKNSESGFRDVKDYEKMIKTMKINMKQAKADLQNKTDLTTPNEIVECKKSD